MPHSQGVGEMRLWFVVPRATSFGEYCKIILLRSGCWAEAVWLRYITPIFFLEPHGGTREVVPVPTAEEKVNLADQLCISLALVLIPPPAAGPHPLHRR